MQIISFKSEHHFDVYRPPSAEPDSALLIRLVAMLEQGSGAIVVISNKPDTEVNGLCAQLEHSFIACGQQPSDLRVLDLLTSTNNRSTLSVDLLHGTPLQIAERFKLMYQTWLRLFSSCPGRQPAPCAVAGALSDLLTAPWAWSVLASHDLGAFRYFLQQTGFPYLAQLQAIFNTVLDQPCLRARLFAPDGDLPALSYSNLIKCRDLFLLVLPPASYTGAGRVLSAALDLDLRGVLP